MDILGKRKLYCNWDLLRFVVEEQIKDRCIALYDVIDDIYFEVGIYLYPNNGLYYVRVYRSDKEDDFDKFIFEDYEKAREFADHLIYEHPEYIKRPYMKFV